MNEQKREMKTVPCDEEEGGKIYTTRTTQREMFVPSLFRTCCKPVTQSGGGGRFREFVRWATVEGDQCELRAGRLTRLIANGSSSAKPKKVVVADVQQQMVSTSLLHPQKGE